MQSAPKIHAALTRESIKPADTEAVVNDASAGAIVSFNGVTRNEHLGKTVLYLEYEAHEPLALQLLRDLCGDAVKKYSLTGAAIHHRLGRLEIGESSVCISASSAHRGAAFDGCRYIIDTLKTSVPIFKKEYYADGTPANWVGPDGKPVLINQ